jgi:hypothetical protein
MIAFFVTTVVKAQFKLVDRCIAVGTLDDEPSVHPLLATPLLLPLDCSVLFDQKVPVRTQSSDLRFLWFLNSLGLLMDFIRPFHLCIESRWIAHLRWLLTR